MSSKWQYTSSKSSDLPNNSPHPRSTTYYLLLATYYLLLATYYSLLITYYSLPTIYYLLLAERDAWFAINSQCQLHCHARGR